MQQSTADRRVSFPALQPLALAIAGILAAHAAPAAEATGGLEEIIVTAQRRSENLQDVPISIQALDSRMLQQLSITQLRQLREVPAEPVVPVLRPGAIAALRPRRVQRQRQLERRLLATGRRVPRRAAGHDHLQQPRRLHLRHRAGRGAVRATGHVVRREFDVRHAAHHHQQAADRGSSRLGTTSASPRSTRVGRAAASRGS